MVSFNLSHCQFFKYLCLTNVLNEKNRRKVYHFLIFIAICLPESRSNSASLGFEIVVASKRLQIANVAVDVSGH